MNTVTCDFCGRVIDSGDWRYGLNFCKAFKVLWIRRDLHSSFDDDDICKDCFYKFLKLYENLKDEVKNG